MLSLMAENLALNRQGMDPCYVAELNWGEPIPPTSASTPPVPPKPDVLLLADCVYLETAFQPLVDTMVDLSTKETEILVCARRNQGRVRCCALADLSANCCFPLSSSLSSATKREER